ncbi:MAG: hypothetical protein HC772_11450 [Leptolyngbyaceae cyanobacterium CRU_2_3]|nr:hypothetical protein [Leptolyngbyaceae cyanobacterium CRU_2_3]
MSTLINLLRTLLITGILSFFVPFLLIGTILVGLMVVRHIPSVEMISTIGLDQILSFLIVFGTGSAIRGLFTISIVSSLVSVLFDTYTFYRYQILRDS